MSTHGFVEGGFAAVRATAIVVNAVLTARRYCAAVHL